MKVGETIEYKGLLCGRVSELLEHSGLEIEGFAEYLHISSSHMYALLNGTRELTEEIANRIGSAFNITGANILRANYRIPKKLKRSKELNNFYDKNKSVKSYFRNTRIERKDSFFIENEIRNSKLLNEPTYIWELKEYCESKGRKYSSKQLSQILNYMVIRKVLKKKKEPLKLRDGEYGSRMVDVFYK